MAVVVYWHYKKIVKLDDDDVNDDKLGNNWWDAWTNGESYR